MVAVSVMKNCVQYDENWRQLNERFENGEDVLIHPLMKATAILAKASRRQQIRDAAIR